MIELVDACHWRGTLYTIGGARRAINEAIGAIICKHATALCQLDKYVATANYLESHIAEFAELASLQADLSELGGAA